MTKIHELKEGQVATIVKIEGEARFLSRVTSIGLCLGGTIEILRNQHNMPLLLYSRDSMVALNREESSNVFVEERS